MIQGRHILGSHGQIVLWTKALRNWFLWRARPQLMRPMSLLGNSHVLPDFLIIGAAKSGTTSLFHYLLQHPGVAAPSVKEVAFFNSPNNYRLGENWYRAHFPAKIAMQKLSNTLGYRALTAEATPSMNINTHAAHAHALVPQARLIIILRNPVDRTYSHYQHQRRKIPREKLPFWDALQAEPDRTAEDLRLNNIDPDKVGHLLRRYGYTHKSLYIDHIEHWLEYFPREHLKIVNFETLTREPQIVCDEIFQHVGLPAYKINQTRTLNPGAYKETMEDRCREYLTEYFRPYNRRLFEFLDEGWDWPC